MEKKKILIVEDEATLQKSLMEYLSMEGFEILEALDGEEGLRIAKREKPDLILLDIILPKKDGYEVLAELKAADDTKNIPVVLLTNLGSYGDIQKAIDRGATNYLIKADFTLDEIVAKIKEILKLK